MLLSSAKYTILLLYLLQVSSIIKNFSKSAPKTATRIVAQQSKKLSKISNAGQLLIADDLLRNEKTLLTEELKSGVSLSDDIAKKENMMIDDAFKAKGVKPKIKSQNETLKELRNDQIEQAIQELLFEKMSRGNSLWDYSVYEILSEPYFEATINYLSKKYGYKDLKKAELFLLLHEKRVDNERLSKRQVCDILSKFSLSYKTASIKLLKVELSKYDAIVHRLQMYQDSEIKKWRLKKRRKI